MAKKTNTYQFYKIKNTIGSIEFIHAPFLKLFTDKKASWQRFKSINEAHQQNSVFDCLQYLAYALCCSGAFTESQLNFVYEICQKNDSLDPLYQALGFDVAIEYNRFIQNKIELEPCLFFLKNAKDEFIHALIFDGKNYVYDLGFGKTEDSWRSRKREIIPYLNMTDTNKLFVCKISQMPLKKYAKELYIAGMVKNDEMLAGMHKPFKP